MTAFLLALAPELEVVEVESSLDHQKTTIDQLLSKIRQSSISVLVALGCQRMELSDWTISSLLAVVVAEMRVRSQQMKAQLMRCCVGKKYQSKLS